MSTLPLWIFGAVLVGVLLAVAPVAAAAVGIALIVADAYLRCRS